MANIHVENIRNASRFSFIQIVAATPDGKVK
jgi:hypothetical protein